jgi:Flp pilus assembly protein TadG
MIWRTLRKNATSRSWLSSARELIRYESGGSLVELAIVLVIFFPLIIVGLLEFGGLVYDYVEVCNASHAGAAYAAQYYVTKSSLPSSVTTQVTNDSPELQSTLKPSTTLSVVEATGCSGGSATTGNTVPTCTAPSLPYVQVTVTATVVPPGSLTLPGFPSSFTLTSKAQMTLVQ